MSANSKQPDFITLTLPDGTVVKNVPKGMTRDEVLREILNEWQPTAAVMQEHRLSLEAREAVASRAEREEQAARTELDGVAALLEEACALARRLAASVEEWQQLSKDLKQDLDEANAKIAAADDRDAEKQREIERLRAEVAKRPKPHGWDITIQRDGMGNAFGLTMKPSKAR